MDTDFPALASRVAALGDVHGCIVMSADGLVLGAFPPGDEDRVKPAWLRFASLGEPERSFVRFSSSETWAYVRSGQYAAFAVAGGVIRPGVLLDHLEQALLVATDSRDRRQSASEPDRVELVAGIRPKAVPAPRRAESWVGPSTAPPAEPESVRPRRSPSSSPGEEEVDRVVLAREFAGLLQERQLPDEEDA